MKVLAALLVSIAMMGVFASPSFADKGGVPNEKSGNTTGGSQNSHGGNPNSNCNASSSC